MDYLKSLATTFTQESAVNDLTPTMVADIYMTSKINSIRLARMRNYIIPDDELELLSVYETETRSTSVEFFINAYIQNELLNVLDLSQSYNRTDDKYPATLDVFFYLEGVQISSDISTRANNGGELIIVTNKDLTNASIVSIMRSLAQTPTYINIKTLGLWPFNNAFEPESVLVTDKSEIAHLVSQRSIESPIFLPRIQSSSLACIYLGAKPGNVIIQTNINVDKGAAVSKHLKLLLVV